MNLSIVSISFLSNHLLSIIFSYYYNEHVLHKEFYYFQKIPKNSL